MISSGRTADCWEPESFWDPTDSVILLGSYGLRILTSRDAKKAYTHGTAAVFRMKDEVLKDVSLIRENCGDIAAEAKELNEKRQAMDEAQQIEDAKAILAAANESAE